MTKNRVYIALIIVGAAGAISGILMRRSGSPSLQHAASLIGWSGIAILLIARIFFSRRRSVPPAKPSSNPKG